MRVKHRMLWLVLVKTIAKPDKQVSSASACKLNTGRNNCDPCKCSHACSHFLLSSWNPHAPVYGADLHSDLQYKAFAPHTTQLRHWLVHQLMKLT